MGKALFAGSKHSAFPGSIRAEVSDAATESPTSNAGSVRGIRSHSAGCVRSMTPREGSTDSAGERARTRLQLVVILSALPSSWRS